MFDKVVFHIDVNSAFLSWEAVYRIKHLGGKLDLRDIPSVIGGDQEKRRGIILAKSLSAKQYGIQTGQSIIEAKQKCPELLIVPPNYNLYEKSSRAFINILKDFTPSVEQYSIDEAYMDMTGINLFGTPVETANILKDRIHNELGFTVNIGVSSNKMLAKMASDFRKPDLVHTLFPDEMKDKMWRLPVSELFFVGRATTKKLFSLGIKTIGELANTDIDILKLHFKKHGEMIWDFANGHDFSLVESTPPPNKGYGNSTTIPFDVTDPSIAKMVLLALAETVASRLRHANVKAEIVTVGIKDYEFHYASHQMVLISPTNITVEIHKYASRLFERLWDGKPIRHLGIHTSRIKDQTANRQLNMFDYTDYDRLEKLDQAVDIIRDRYGIDAVKRAVFVKGPIDHLSGGISREKRTVDYTKEKID